LGEEETVDNVVTEAETESDKAEVVAETSAKTEPDLTEQYKGLQRELSKRDARIQELEKQPQANAEMLAEIRAMRDGTKKALSTLFKSQSRLLQAQADGTEITASDISGLSEEWTRLFDEDYKREFDSLLASSGLGIDDPRLARVKSASSVQEGIERLKLFIEAKGPVKAPEAKQSAETEEQLRERIRKEVEADLKKEQNLRETSTATPSGANITTFKGVRDAFIADPTNPRVMEAYYKARRERGI